jgi:hypothetical protein
VASLPATAKTVSGKNYRFPANPLQLQTVRFDFEGSTEASMTISFAGGEPSRVGAVGLDGVYRFSPGKSKLPVGIRGSWIDDNTFTVEYDTVASSDAFDLRAFDPRSGTVAACFTSNSRGLHDHQHIFSSKVASAGLTPTSGVK